MALDWFDQEFLDITVAQYLGIAAIVLGALLAQSIIVRIVRLVARRRAGTGRRAFWAIEVRRIDRALLGILFWAAAVIGVPLLRFGPDVQDALLIAARLIGAASGVWLAMRLIDIGAHWFENRAQHTDSRFDDQLIPVLRTSVQIVALVIGVLFVLANLNVNIASLLAGLGIGGLAIALAAQDTVKNLLGGVTVFADRPFQVGDWIVLGDVEGTVEEVGFRSTRIRTFYSSKVTVPNARMTDSVIDNMGLRQWRRYTTTLGLAYDTPPEKIQAFVEGVRAIILATPNMRHDYYFVEFNDWGESTLDILLYCFFDAADWGVELRTRHILNLDILRLAADLEVDFAFPTRTLHLVETPTKRAKQPEVPPAEEIARLITDYGPDGRRVQRKDRPFTSGFDFARRE